MTGKTRWLTFVGLVAAAFAAAAETTLQDIRVRATPERTRVVLDLSAAVEHRLFTLDGPPRVVVDLHDAGRRSALAGALEGKGAVKRIRTGLHEGGDLRVVLDLEESIPPKSFALAPDGEHGHRLVIDLESEDTAGDEDGPPATERRDRNREPVVEVEAGHGGEEPGAIGPNGGREKDVASRTAPPSAAPAAYAHPVEVAEVAAIDTDRAFALTGVTRAAERAQLAFQVSGRLAERSVSIGDEVAAGDPIARLEQPELRPAAAAARARAEQIETELAQAGRDFERVRKLYARDAATRQELESAQSRRDSLAASLRRVRAEAERGERMLAETRIAAPVTGTVEQVYFEPGEFVPAGRPVVGLSGGGVLEVEIGLPEVLLSEVAIGDRADLTLPLLGGETSGRVTELASASPGPGRLFPAVITLDRDGELRPGVTVAWHLRSAGGKRLTVPVAAIASTGGRDRPKVFRVDNGKVEVVPVRLGMVVGERVVVSGDLAPGQWVVTLGLSGLVDGRAVEVR